ncbi:DNA binding methylated-DNA--cysteine S-methyltransferase [Piedraia hortae CBS 480.64]|uniref:DNA binding methylated-DNA--cysteine S-methyltransferase n=1 Tax=Piedraia hortae CBS 480.64 TaxID=1314780 RepID=A0A6A7C916_9PEZI|nr:DNA binding methylated-DNA--cysteine S-methyltransferase [Piedraia hortae CBS 480.64]
MPRSDEAEAWFHSVYTTIQLIPHGRVTSYGHIAAMIGRPERPRQVGIALKHLPSSGEQTFNSNTVPWQRVVSARGIISPRDGNGAERQASALEAEGVEVTRTALGERKVDLSVYGWFPEE